MSRTAVTFAAARQHFIRKAVGDLVRASPLRERHAGMPHLCPNLLNRLWGVLHCLNWGFTRSLDLSDYGPTGPITQVPTLSTREIAVEIGERIAAARGAMTQAKFAELLHVDRKTVVRWETGQRMPDCESLVNIRQRLSVSLDWVLTGDGDAAPAGALSAEDLQVLEHYRALDADGRKAVMRAMQMEQLRARAEALESLAPRAPVATRLELHDSVAQASPPKPAPSVRRVPKSAKP